jgi:hypothetical protein
LGEAPLLTFLIVVSGIASSSGYPATEPYTLLFNTRIEEGARMIWGHSLSLRFEAVRSSKVTPPLQSRG